MARKKPLSEQVIGDHEVERPPGRIGHAARRRIQEVAVHVGVLAMDVVEAPGAVAYLILNAG